MSKDKENDTRVEPHELITHKRRVSHRGNLSHEQAQELADQLEDKSWKLLEDSVLVKDFGTEPSTKIVLLDNDHTIIKGADSDETNHEYNWTFTFKDKTVKEKMKEFHNDGYKIAICSSQAGIGHGDVPINYWTQKINEEVKELGVPAVVFGSITGGYNQKPSTGMWEILLTQYNGNIDPKDIELDKCMMIGDAAGRPKRAGLPADPHDSDYKFAMNIGIKFYTPEQFFLSEVSDLPAIKFDPKTFKKTMEKLDIPPRPLKPEMVIFVGTHGAGKTTFFHNYYEPAGYTHINLGIFKNAPRALKAAEEALAKGESIVVDGTNRSKEGRKLYINLAKKMEVPVKCVYFDVDKDLAIHLNALKNYKQVSDDDFAVSEATINSFFRELKEPTTKEGFEDVKVVKFQAGPFKDEREEKLFYYYL